MNILKTTGLPAFVQITIVRETNFLLSHSLFSKDEKDDIIQDLILYYLERFHRRTDFDEAYIVASLKNQALKLLRTKARQRFGLFLSLDDMETLPTGLIGDGGFSEIGFRILLSELSYGLKDKEQLILEMVQEGYSLDEIAKNYHISKNTIYKLFEKIKEIYKK